MAESRGSGPDPIGDFQRWLVRSGARSMSRELGGHLAGAFGLGGKSGDVWETATAPPPEEAPECAWCPVCRAARLLRESGPGLASHVAAASDTLAGLVQEAASAVESALAAAGRRAGPGGDRAAGRAWDSGTPADWDVTGQEWDTATAAGPEADTAGPEAAAAVTVWAEATGTGNGGPAGHAVGGNGASGNGASGNGASGNGAGGNGAGGSGAEGPGSPASPE